jgi:catechol 2,3-dioxygenase-like lactoylglutathione lyase family enzyme
VIFGAHVVLFSTDAEADRAFLGEVLGFDSVDAGGGWLIFALPPAEAALHPAEAPAAELYLMTDDLAAEMRALRVRGVTCAEVEEERWGSITKITLPSGGQISLYQPKHPTTIDGPDALR